MQKFGVCKLSIVPCRAEDSDKSEMVTQLLFGELYEVLEEGEKFVKIKTHYDLYECWICIKQHFPISENEFNSLKSNKAIYLNELLNVVESNNGMMPIAIGSFLYGDDGSEFILQNEKYVFDGDTIIEPFPRKSKIVEDAFIFSNAPYLWGGKTPFGIDCSGFTQQVYKLNGIKLPRDAYQQANLGSTYSFVEESEAGDLAFFDNADGKIIHVGIVLGDSKIIHASGKVRIDKLDHYGIFNNDLNKYTHKLRVIKKII
ncbi:MAG: hypothetical protein RLZZ414_1745 [Bacteroidota bacterium]|jgi:hypothetical protein